MDAEEAELCWSRASLHVPEKDSWGFYFLPDVPMDYMGDIFSPGFLWFSDRKEVLHFLGQVVPASRSGEFWLEPAGQEACAQLVGDFQAREVEPDAGDWKGFRESLNQTLAGYLTVMWIGTFGELVHSDGFFPKYARMIFRLTKKLAGNDIRRNYAPVPPCDKSGFLDFIMNWEREA